MKKFLNKWLPVIIICAIIVVIVAIVAAATAAASDEDRLEYELSSDGSYYIVTKMKDSYGDGWFCKETLTVPSTHDGLPVKEISQIKTSGIKEIIISDGIETIGTTAFTSSAALTTVVLPDSVTTIGKNAFMNCYNLSTINLPKNLTTIESGAFEKCEKLSSMTIDTNKYEFSDGILYEKKSTSKDIICIAHAVGDLTLTDGLTEIKSKAFQEFRSLTSIVIPDGVTSIGNQAFASCAELTNITIPKSVVKIGKQAFNNCKQLTTINYSGTMEEWNIIEKGTQWSKTNASGSVLTIICSDGTVNIELN